jgi:hypothetical protein
LNANRVAMPPHRRHHHLNDGAASARSFATADRVSEIRNRTAANKLYVSRVSVAPHRSYNAPDATSGDEQLCRRARCVQKHGATRMLHGDTVDVARHRSDSDLTHGRGDYAGAALFRGAHTQTDTPPHLHSLVVSVASHGCDNRLDAAGCDDGASMSFTDLVHYQGQRLGGFGLHRRCIRMTPHRCKDDFDATRARDCSSAGSTHIRKARECTTAGVLHASVSGVARHSHDDRIDGVSCAHVVAVAAGDMAEHAAPRLLHSGRASMAPHC